MAIESFSDLSEMHISVLSEIGNIGSGNATTSLSQMLSQPVEMSTPEVGIANYNEAYEKLGGAETVMVGLVLTLSGDMSGMLMFLLPCDVACNLINIVAFTDFKDYTEIDEMGFSAVSEMANIMSGAFVNAIGDMTGMTIDISPPAFTVDMLGAMMSLPASYFAEIGDLFMFIKNEIEIAGKKTPANILLLPDMPSLDKLMSVLGLG
ncbi:MAG: chemotaxis protein CheC [Oscillospiraceae bacterium]|nr:chemotaxis protein CheC [Oscillospiraceae bacterium]